MQSGLIAPRRELSICPVNSTTGRDCSALLSLLACTWMTVVPYEVPICCPVYTLSHPDLPLSFPALCPDSAARVSVILATAFPPFISDPGQEDTTHQRYSYQSDSTHRQHTYSYTVDLPSRTLIAQSIHRPLTTTLDHARLLQEPVWLGRFKGQGQGEQHIQQ